MFELWQYPFMQQAFLAGAIVACLCPVIGLFLVVRRLALIGDGLGHISFAGVAAGWLWGVYPIYTAALFTVFGAMVIEKLRAQQQQFADTALAMIFYTGIATAIILTSMVRTATNNLLGYLFGSIVTVSRQDLLVIAMLAGIVLFILAALYKELIYISCDEEVAKVNGLPVAALNMLLAVLTALTVSVAMRVVGLLLVSALMIVPVAASLQIARSFRGALCWSVIFAQISVIAGLAASFYFDLAPGGTIVLAGVGIFIIVYAGKATFRASCPVRSRQMSKTS
jgi:zinc transport system permease protein